MNNLKGVTYYKLSPGFSGDKTKNCGLTGPEIDANFNFLRGNDINEVSFDKDNGVLMMTKVNGDTLSINITPKKPSIVCCNENNDNTLEDVISIKCNCKRGFTFTDNTIEGNGTEDYPLSISSILKTGFYSPAIKYIDMTSGDTLPLNPEIGDRYVTKEFYGEYGLLYNFDGLKVIDKNLKDESSKWRVPTITDWSEMLNAVEPCEEGMTHKSEISSPYLGELAGGILKKRSEEWLSDSLGEQKLSKTYGFDILPCGLMYDNTYVGFGKLAEFWSSTLHKNGDIWAKKFVYNKNTVQQRAEEIDNFFSIRLVREINGDYNSNETILGNYYDCIKMPSINENGDIVYKSWIKQNLLYRPLLNGNADNENALAVEVLDENGNTINDIEKLYITEWDGTEWIRYELKDNFLIVLEEGLNGEIGDEWIVKDSELIRRNSIIYDEIFNDLTDYLDGQIDAVEKYINEIVDVIYETIKSFADGLQDYIDDNISGLTEELNSRVRNVNETDKILSVDENNDIISTISFGFTDNKIQLVGKNDIVIDEFDISEYINAGALDDVKEENGIITLYWKINGVNKEVTIDIPSLIPDIKYLKGTEYTVNKDNDFSVSILYSDNTEAFKLTINNDFGEINI